MLPWDFRGRQFQICCLDIEREASVGFDSCCSGFCGIDGLKYITLIFKAGYDGNQILNLLADIDHYYGHANCLQYFGGFSGR